MSDNYNYYYNNNIEWCKNYLSSLVRQFGFESKLSCSMYLKSYWLLLIYIDNETTPNVPVCYIDISKAFDGLNFYCLLLKHSEVSTNFIFVCEIGQINHSCMLDVVIMCMNLFN